MKIICIIQARLSSSRLPGKILLPLGDKPILHHVYDRAASIAGVSEVIIATTTEPSEDPIEEFCITHGIPCVRGSVNDVLSRYYQAAKPQQADHVIRITSDCPLLDPAVTGALVKNYIAGPYDYGVTMGFPHGLDSEIFTFDMLEKAHHQATSKEDREHVTLWIKRQNTVKKYRFKADQDGLANHYRWVVDYPEDYDYLAQLFPLLPAGITDWQTCKSVADKYVDLKTINQGRIEEWQKLTHDIIQKAAADD